MSEKAISGTHDRKARLSNPHLGRKAAPESLRSISMAISTSNFSRSRVFTSGCSPTCASQRLRPSSLRPNDARRQRISPCRALEIDWTSPDTLISVAGAFLGLGLGIGVPVFYLSRDAKDKEKLEYVREMNRKRFEETGEYMTEEEIAKIRTPKWTDRREFADDD